MQTQRTTVHRPIADGDCTGCHNPHGSDYQYFLIDDPGGGLCFRCHSANEFQSRKHVHGPVEAGACLVCHEAHSSWNAKLLAKDDRQLCAPCHRAEISDLRMVRHPHRPAAEGRCTTCHDPHASDHPAQLRNSPQALCLSCHEHDPIRTLLESSKCVHGAAGTGDSCTACHSGHGTSLPKLLSAPVMSLCLGCHDQSLEAPDGRRLVNMTALLRENPDHHGPIRRADCSACHDPHAAPNFSLLTQPYPETFYAPFNLSDYQLCFGCHIEEMVTAEDGRGVTGFRNGEQNLHFVHVNNERKGRTCRACHEVHASKRPFHIRESVPFGAGGWEIEINFEASPQGGRCAPACHEAKSYRRDPGADAPRAAPVESRSNGQ